LSIAFSFRINDLRDHDNRMTRPIAVSRWKCAAVEFRTRAVPRFADA
jgi:hypothetical protein